MAEYIEREALLDSLRESRKELQRICEGLKFPVEKQICDAQIFTFQECILRAKKQPTADVVPVVRCKDCIDCEKDVQGNTFCVIWGGYCEEIHYCGYGERKIEDA